MRRHFQAVGCALAIALIASVFACQAVNAQTRQPAAQADTTHRGFYLGVQAGGGIATTDVSLIGTPLAVDGVSGKGAVYGVLTGYDFRVGNIVGGPFAEWSHQDLSFDVKPGILNATLGNSWTLGGRVGLAWGNALPYVLVGHTWTDSDLSIVGTSISSQRLQGWTYGAGMDLALTHNIVAGIRYAHTKYENEDVLGLGIVKLERDQDTVTGRLAYKFDFLQ